MDTKFDIPYSHLLVLARLNHCPSLVLREDEPIAIASYPSCNSVPSELVLALAAELDETGAGFTVSKISTPAASQPPADRADRDAESDPCILKLD